jgi:hypothetical protein
MCLYATSASARPSFRDRSTIFLVLINYLPLVDVLCEDQYPSYLQDVLRGSLSRRHSFPYNVLRDF